MGKLIKNNAPNAVLKACNVLSKGGIIAYPTDTLYGLGCDSKNETSIKTLNKIKNRSGPISVIAPNKNTAINWMSIKENQKETIENKLKNGNTIIAPVKKNICSSLILGNGNTLGIRIPEHLFCKELSILFPNPITSTSVNRTGEKPYTKPNDILNEFTNDIDLIIDDGIIKGVGSKIFLFKNGFWKQLR